jgi:hypothetical protein
MDAQRATRAARVLEDVLHDRELRDVVGIRDDDQHGVRGVDRALHGDPLAATGACRQVLRELARYLAELVAPGLAHEAGDRDPHGRGALIRAALDARPPSIHERQHHGSV